MISQYPVIQFTHEQMQQMVQHARSAAPFEACGLVVGMNGDVRQILPIENIAPDQRHHFQMSPQQLLTALREIDKSAYQITAIYHSHPAGDAIPSQTDISFASREYPDIPQIIIGMKHTVPDVKMWLLKNEHVQIAQTVLGEKILFYLPESTRFFSQQIMFVLTILVSVVILLLTAVALLPPAPQLIVN